jgi:glucose-1-phosphate adenylyltransferase
VVVGIRSRIAGGAQIRRSLLLGADSYETIQDMERARSEGVPPVGIGEDAVIENAIVDKDARIGRGVRITNERGERDRDCSNYHIRDGVVVIPKGAVVPDGSVI